MSRPTHVLTVISFIALGMLLPFLGGCDDRAPINPVPTPVATAPAEKPLPVITASTYKPEEPTPSFPGFAVGRVFGADGKPIALPESRIEIIETGLLDDIGNPRVTFPLNVRPDGIYIERLKPGAYLQPSGRIEFSFNNERYRLPLTPRPPLAKRQDASDGVAQDFVWKLEGPVPGERGDKNRPETWIGGKIDLEYRSVRPDGRVLRSPPPGTKVVFTLIPKSPLADGSEGKTRTAIRSYNALQASLLDASIIDIPLAMWEVRGEEHFPDGGRSGLRFLLSDGRTLGDAVTGTFKADLAKSSLQQVTITFTRREQ